MIGRVTAVRESKAQTELAAAVVAGATELPLVAIGALDLKGGTLSIGDELIAYTVDGNKLTLADPLIGSYDAETPVALHPPAIERVAFVQGEGQHQEVEVRVPHSLYALLPLGIRANQAVAESIETALRAGELVVDDVLGREPDLDAGFVNTKYGELPFVTGIDPLDEDYQVVDDALVPGVSGRLTFRPETDSLLRVAWGVSLSLYNDAGFTINGAAYARLMVNGVPVGLTAEHEKLGRFDPGGPNPIDSKFVGAETNVPMVAGEEYEIAVGARADMITGEARAKGDKTGGLNFVVFAA